MNKLGLILTFLLIYTFALCQQGLLLRNGATSMGLGGGMVNLKGLDASFGNPAGISFYEGKYGIGLNYQNTYASNNINHLGLNFILKANSSYWGLSVNSFGIEEFNERSIQLAYARKILDALNIGIEFNHSLLSIKNAANLSNQGFKIGFQSTITKELSFSGMIFSPIFKEKNESIYPNIHSIGLAYSPSKKVTVYSEFIKKTAQPTSFIIGTRYLPLSKIEIQTGMDIAKGEIGFSIGYLHNKTILRGAYSSHQYLGSSFGMTAQYILKK